MNNHQPFFVVAESRPDGVQPLAYGDSMYVSLTKSDVTVVAQVGDRCYLKVCIDEPTVGIGSSPRLTEEIFLGLQLVAIEALLNAEMFVHSVSDEILVARMYRVAASVCKAIDEFLPV